MDLPEDSCGSLNIGEGETSFTCGFIPPKLLSAGACQARAGRQFHAETPPAASLPAGTSSGSAGSAGGQNRSRVEMSSHATKGGYSSSVADVDNLNIPFNGPLIGFQ